MKYSDFKIPSFVGFEKMAQSFEESKEEINESNQDLGKIQTEEVQEILMPQEEFDYLRDIIFGLKTLVKIDECFTDHYVEFLGQYGKQSSDYDSAQEIDLIQTNLRTFLPGLSNIIIKQIRIEQDNKKREFLLSLIEKLNEKMLSLT